MTHKPALIQDLRFPQTTSRRHPQGLAKKQPLLVCGHLQKPPLIKDVPVRPKIPEKKRPNKYILDCKSYCQYFCQDQLLEGPLCRGEGGPPHIHLSCDHNPTAPPPPIYIKKIRFCWVLPQTSARDQSQAGPWQTLKNSSCAKETAPTHNKQIRSPPERRPTSRK